MILNHYGQFKYRPHLRRIISSGDVKVFAHKIVILAYANYLFEKVFPKFRGCNEIDW
jgi:hypothetical protein